jgi:hypothetical protein
MKRTIAAVLALIVIFGGGPAEAHHRPGPCPIHWLQAWRKHRDVEPIKDLIRCAAWRWPVPGGPAFALDVAWCESRFRPNAVNGRSQGLYQHVVDYWPGRYERWTYPRWRLYPSIWNARTQAIVTMRMVHAGGWGPWEGGACA